MAFKSFKELRNNVDPKPSPMSRGADGVDHINIGDQAKTHLGRLLSLTKVRGIQHPQLGNFSSIQSVWSFVRSVEQDDRTRTLHGKKLLNFSHRMGSRRVINFTAIIAAIYVNVIENDAELKSLLIENDLPFDYYDTVNEVGLRVRKKFEHWLVPIITDISKALKEGKSLMDVALNMRDNKSKPIFYDAIVGMKMEDHLPTAKHSDEEKEEVLLEEKIDNLEEDSNELREELDEAEMVDFLAYDSNAAKQDVDEKEKEVV